MDNQTPFPSWIASGRQHAIKKGTAHVWRLELPAQDSAFIHLEQFLSADELKRLGSCALKASKKKFIASRGVLRYLLGGYLQCAPSSIELDYNPYGKPFISQSNLSFNVSHSGSCIVYAFTTDCRLGIDIELIKQDVAAEKIAKKLFSADEQRSLQSLPPEKKAAAFFRLWTLKEAYYKALGTGLSYPLPSIDGAQGWSIHSLPLEGGYCGALVLEENRSLYFYDLLLPF